MATFFLVFAGGVLAVASPCVLPVVPLLFAGTGGGFRRGALPLLLGLAASFAVVTSVGTLTAGWIADAGSVGRWLALALLGAVGMTLLSERFAAAVARPFVALGARLDADSRTRPPASSRATAFAAGAAAGLLWAPCAGPILGLVIAAAAAKGAGIATTVLFIDFALGAATALGAIIYLGGRMLGPFRRLVSADRWIRRVAGAVVIAGVLGIAFGAERTVLAKDAFAQPTALEQALVDRASPAPAHAIATGGATPTVAALTATGAALADALPATDEGTMHGFPGATKWLNGAALTPDALKGKVVLVEFWTFECVNCLNALPYVKALYAKYKDRGFVVVGVHTPELPAEHVVSNVERQVHDLGITFPVVVDNTYSIWNAWKNEYWPALYFVDAHGRIRYHHFGEGAYAEEDRVVNQLLYEAGL